MPYSAHLLYSAMCWIIVATPMAAPAERVEIETWDWAVEWVWDHPWRVDINVWSEILRSWNGGKLYQDIMHFLQCFPNVITFRHTIGVHQLLVGANWVWNPVDFECPLAQTALATADFKMTVGASWKITYIVGVKFLIPGEHFNKNHTMLCCHLLPDHLHSCQRVWDHQNSSPMTSAKLQKVYIPIPTNRQLTNVFIFSYVVLPMRVNTQGRFLILEVVCFQISAQLWTLLGNKCKLGQLGPILSKSWVKLSKMS